jgi:hypothetical protein
VADTSHAHSKLSDGRTTATAGRRVVQLADDPAAASSDGGTAAAAAAAAGRRAVPNAGWPGTGLRAVPSDARGKLRHPGATALGVCCRTCWSGRGSHEGPGDRQRGRD